MKKIELSIIILSYNTRELLEQCLESVISDLWLAVSGTNEKTPNHQLASLRGRSGSPITEIIVVDNGSTDGSVEMVNEFSGLTSSKEKKFQPVNALTRNRSIIKLIQNKENLGYSKGNNIGIREAKGQYIMLLNSDTVVQPGALESLINYLGKFPENMAVSPLLLLPSGKSQTDYYLHFPNLWQVFLYHNPVLRPMVMKTPFLSSLIVQISEDKPFAVDQLPGAALMASKSVWQKVGYLDESYNFLFEDVDWCWRARESGIKLVVIPEARVTHVGGASWKQKLKENSSQFYYQFFASMLLFAGKNYGKRKGGIFKWAIILNFILTLKLNLAWKFLKNNGKQAKFLK